MMKLGNCDDRRSFSTALQLQVVQNHVFSPLLDNWEFGPCSNGLSKDFSKDTSAGIRRSGRPEVIRLRERSPLQYWMGT